MLDRDDGDVGHAGDEPLEVAGVASQERASRPSVSAGSATWASMVSSRWAHPSNSPAARPSRGVMGNWSVRASAPWMRASPGPAKRLGHRDAGSPRPHPGAVPPDRARREPSPGRHPPRSGRPRPTPRHQARRRISAGDAVRAEPVAAHLRAPRHLGTFRALGPDQWPISKCLTPSSCSRAAATSRDTARQPTLFLICSTSGAGGLTKTRLSLRGVTASNLDVNHALATSWP